MMQVLLPPGRRKNSMTRYATVNTPVALRFFSTSLYIFPPKEHLAPCGTHVVRKNADESLDPG